LTASERRTYTKTQILWERRLRNVTLTLPEDVLARARVEAARSGKSLSRFVSELVERRVGRARTQSEALAAFLSGPLLDLTDENGNAPSRDKLYE
jgi:plasmid stability protein